MDGFQMLADQIHSSKFCNCKTDCCIYTCECFYLQTH